MNIDNTIDNIRVVTPKLAMTIRSHTTWYTRLQNPEAIKNVKSQSMGMITSPLILVMPDKAF